MKKLLIPAFAFMATATLAYAQTGDVIINPTNVAPIKPPATNDGIIINPNNGKPPVRKAPPTMNSSAQAADGTEINPTNTLPIKRPMNTAVLRNGGTIGDPNTPIAPINNDTEINPNNVKPIKPSAPVQASSIAAPAILIAGATGDSSTDSRLKLLRSEFETKMKALVTEYQAKAKAIIGSRPIILPNQIDPIKAKMMPVQSDSMMNRGDGSAVEAKKEELRKRMNLPVGAPLPSPKVEVQSSAQSFFRSLFGGNATEAQAQVR